MAVSGTLDVSTLNARFSKTKQAEYSSDVDKYILDCIQRKLIMLPVLDYMFELAEDYRQSMINLYNGTFGTYEGVLDIPDNVKAAQGAVIDSLMYFYDTAENKFYGVCTLNMGLLGLDPVLDEKILNKVFKANQEGKIHSMRIDFNYNYGDQSADFKVVAHKKVIDNADTVFLIPYAVGYELCRFINSYLNQGGILAVCQTLENDATKVRCISTNYKHLSHYCEDEAACTGMTAELYPLQAFVYAPVLGAPSTTAMKTRIDLFNLDWIAKITSYGQCKELGVQKSPDGVDDLYREAAIISTMSDLKANNIDEFFRVLDKIPENRVMSKMLEGDVGTSTIANYIHSSKRGDVSNLLKIVPGAMEAYTRRKKFNNSESKGEEVSPDALKSMLKSHVVKVVWKKPNGMYSSAICTNSNDILSEVYGKDYFGRYESWGVRLRSALEDVDMLGMPLETALSSYGFEADKAKDILAKSKDEKVSLYDAALSVFGKKAKNPTSSDTVVTARTLSAYLGSDYDDGNTTPKSVDYYVSVDLNHIVRANVVY